MKSAIKTDLGVFTLQNESEGVKSFLYGRTSRVYLGPWTIFFLLPQVAWFVEFELEKSKYGELGVGAGRTWVFNNHYHTIDTKRPTEPNSTVYLFKIINFLLNIYN